MQKIYKVWFWLSILAIGFVAGCAYSNAEEEKIPNLGILKPISWESQKDPERDGYIQKFVLHDTERNHDYIVVETYPGGLAITDRK